MPPIRTLLWIGPSEELGAFGVLDAPSLDVVWIDHPDALDTLPPLALDAVVLGRLGAPLNHVLSALAMLRHSRIEGPVLVLRTSCPTDERRAIEQSTSIRVLTIEHGGEAVCEGSAALLEAVEACLRRDERSARATAPPPRPGAGPPLVGASRATADVERGIRCAAGSAAPVLVLGETGVGKEIVARRVHAQSPRHGALFVAVNCAALAESLLESELFGHRRGAFTGADRDRVGLFERAEGGTVFLDEIGETSPALQARLLRVLQEREVLPVGGDRPRSVDVRVVAATHRDLGAEIEGGRFREDLFYRLAVLQVSVPPLRTRPADVVPLAEHFLELHGKRADKPGCLLSPRAQRLLASHDWPGNVRELENEMQRVLALSAPGELVTARRLSPTVRRDPQATTRNGAPQPPGVGAEETLQQALDRIEAGLIRGALLEHDGRRARTARRLGVTREGLYKKMKRLNVE